MKKIQNEKIRHIDAWKLWWAFTIAGIIILIVAQLAGIKVD